MFAGRVHPAMVSKVNHQNRSVTVEWYERGETKGKEVELDAIIQLNGETNKPETVPEKKKATTNTYLSRVSFFYFFPFFF